MAPSLAESWTLSADHRTYVFKLRDGLKFHNGDPFTAEDVKFSFGGYPDVDALYRQQAREPDRCQ